MMWEMLLDVVGDVWAVSTMGQPFDDDVVFTNAFLGCPRYRFIRQGDGLIVITALEGVVTYGVLGEAEEHHVPAVRARLLHVRPGLVDQICALDAEAP